MMPSRNLHTNPIDPIMKSKASTSIRVNSRLSATLQTLLFAFFAIVGLTVSQNIQAANGTWTNAPIDATWTNVQNWNGLVVPGTINNTANNGTDSGSIATFTNAISTYGGAANPIIPDDATIANGKSRMLGQVNFDGATCGAYVFYSPSAYAAQTATTPETGVLSLCVPAPVSARSTNGMYMSATVTKPQNFLIPVQIRLPSSDDGTYGFTNNATSPLGTLYFNSLFLYPGGTTRGVTYVLSGSNTGTNTIASLSQSVNQSSGTCGIRKEGSGKWILSGANTFKAGSPMNIFGGTLEVQNASAFGLSSSAVVSNATLQIDGVSLASLSIGLQAGGTIQMNGAGTLNGVVLGTAPASSMTLATTSAGDVSTVSAISGGAADGVVHIAGPGTVAFSSDNLTATNGTWSFDAGTNQLGGANSLGATPKTLTFGAGSTGVLMLNGNSITALSLTSNPTVGTPSVQNINVNPATLTVSNSAANTFGGSLADGAGGGALGFTKTGLGTLILSGASTYTGNTTVSVGALNLTGSLGNSAVTVSSGATLTGNGSIGGSVSMSSGGILAPGNGGVGKLTVASLTLNSGSINNFEFNVSPTNDQAIVTSSGGLTISGGSVNLYQEGGITPFASVGTYNLIKYTGSLTGSASSLSVANPQAGFAYAFGTSGGYVTLTITAAGVNARWNVDADGNWTDGTKWSGGTAPHSAGDSATLGVGTALRTVTLNANQTVGGITFTNNNSFVIANAGNTLTLDNSGSGAPLTVQAGNANAIQTAVALNDNVTANVSSGKSLAVSGVVANTSGAKTLTLNGAGTVSLSGNNSYGPAAGTVGTTLTGGGTLTVGNNNALSTGDVDVTGSSTLQSGAAGLSVANNFTIESLVNATVDNSGNNLTLGGVISGGGTLTKIGNGTLTLGGANTYAGSTTVKGGMLSITLDGNLGAAPGSETPDSIVLNGGTLLGNGSVVLSSTRDIGIGSNAGSVGTNAQIDAASGGTFTISGVIASAGNTGVNGLTVNSGAGHNGTVALISANIFNGPTYIAQGVLDIQNSLALQNSVLDYTNGTLLFDGITTATVADLAGTQNLSLTNIGGAGVTLTLGGDNASVTYPANFTDTGVTSGGGGLRKEGTGTLTLAGTNTLAGDVRAATGVLVIPTNGVIVSGSVTASGSTTPQLQVNGGSIVATNLTIAISGSSGPGNAFINSGSVSLSGTAFINAGGSQVSQNIGITVNTNASLYVSSLSNGRGGLTATTQPGAGQAGQGLIVNGGTVIVTNNASIGTMAGANSGSSLSVNSGSLTVGGSLTFGCNNGGRWSVVDVNGGSLTVTDSVNGVTLGAAFGGNEVFLVRAGTATVGIINLGNTNLVNTGATFYTKAINVTGGSLYIGAGGIVEVATNVTPSITLNGGVLGATAD
jgi:autotransporter-associated beta strand protein